jgi:hypothetical protein
MNISILIFIFSFLACSCLVRAQSKLYAKDEDSDEEVEVPKENLEPKVALKDVMAVIKSTYGQNLNIEGIHFCKKKYDDTSCSDTENVIYGPSEIVAYIF